MNEKDTLSVIDILSDVPIALVLFSVAWRLLGILERVLEELVERERDQHN